MGAFDDLIPKQTAAIPVEEQASPPPVNRFGFFDDLVPDMPPQLPGNETVPNIPTVAGQEAAPRFGDSLKPYVGGRNPIAETYDTFIEPLSDVASDRPILERAQDTVNFAASVPFQALRLPTPGQMAEQIIGPNSLLESEQRFVENNPKLLGALGAVGEVAAGGSGMGQGFRLPQRPQTPQRPASVPENVSRARETVDDMESLGVTPYGPAVAAARRGEDSMGALSQTLKDKPFVGTPLQRGARQFTDEMVEAQDNIRGQYGSSQTMQGAGGQVRARLEGFKDGRSVDVTEMTPEALARLANSPPRLSSFRDVQAAKYHQAERFLPEEKAKAQPVGKGEERVIGGLERTRGILRDIKRRYGLTINKADAARAKRGKKKQLSLENTEDFRNPRWTGSPNVDRSLDAIATENWRTGIEGMREIRSNIRRALSSRGDTEVNALARGDLKRLYKAVSDDMDTMLARLAKQSEDAGNTELAGRYRAARDAYKDADAFTARYAQRLEDVKTLFRVQSDEAVAGSIRTAMQDGTRGNMQRLLSLRRIAPREVMDEISSALIVDLGRPTGRAAGATQEAGFSPSRFASQWNSLSPQARKVVFGHRPKLFAALNRFARVSQGMADFEALANSSRTGVSNAVWAMVGAGGVGAAQVSPAMVAGVAAAMMGGRAAASFLSSPAYVAWLTRAPVILRSGSGAAMAQHLKRLRDMALKDRKLDATALQAIGLAAGNVGDQQ